MPVLKKGLVQVYTGDGKGKTTAAWGAACRMLGAAGRVYICQFLKPVVRVSGETACEKRCGERLTVERLELDWDIRRSQNDPQQVRRMQAAVAEKLDYIKKLAQKGEYDLIVLDEINVCLDKKLAQWEQVQAIIESRAAHLELILTGREAPAVLIERADLVTNMQPVKHPYRKGVKARFGIEY